MYLLNLRSKTIHKHPTLEQCNCDIAKKKLKVEKYKFSRDLKFKKCKHCFK